MKAVFLFFLLLTHLNSFAQVTAQTNCQDTSKYRLINSDAGYAEVQIIVAGTWKSFSIIDEIPSVFEYQCTEINLNDTGSKELVIFWENRDYGSGGGFTIKGIKIWNLDNGAVIFNEIYSCSEESFGRHGGERFLIEYRKNIDIQELTISVNEEEYLSEPTNSDFSSLLENCKITNLKPGIYLFQNEQLKLK